MGNFIRMIKDTLESFADGAAHRIILIGLDASGKTTLLYKLKLGESLSTVPTIGFNVEEVHFKNLNLTIWDVGGQATLIPLWRYYYQGASAVIFMIDSSDSERLEEAAQTLHSVLNDDLLRDAIVLVMANKQDLPQALSINKISEKLDLSSTNRDWNIQSCCAINGEGIYEGFEWLSHTLKNKN